jgi:hypothetical protein
MDGAAMSKIRHLINEKDDPRLESMSIEFRERFQKLELRMRKLQAEVSGLVDEQKNYARQWWIEVEELLLKLGKIKEGFDGSGEYIEFDRKTGDFDLCAKSCAHANLKAALEKAGAPQSLLDLIESAGRDPNVKIEVGIEETAKDEAILH